MSQVVEASSSHGDAVRHDSPTHGLIDSLTPWRWLLVPLGIGLGSRAMVMIVGFVSLCPIPSNPVTAVSGADYCYIFPATRRALVEPWYAWDAGWYLDIALHGYSTSGSEAPSVAFWPLLPMLQWLVQRPLLLVPSADVLVWARVLGLLVALATFLLALALLYRLLISVTRSTDEARRGTTLLAFAPGALFFSTPYPEGLLLAGVSGCLLALHQRRWALAGLAGAVAALAQKPGWLLVLPFAWAYFERERRLGWSIGWVLLIPLAPLAWLMYLANTVGDPLAPFEAAGKFWEHALAWPWQTLAAGIGLALEAPAENALVWLNLAAALTALVASGWALVRGPRAWGVWGLALIVLYLCLPGEEPLKSILRYGLAVVPVWLLLARWLRHPVLEPVALGLFAALQAVLTAMFVHGYWVA
jgi:Mannosyltransferase (PIG-V)